MAFVGIICQAGYNVMQERYIERSGDFSAYNKFLLMFWSKSVELTTLVVFCWLELFIGYSKHPLTAFVDSVKLFVSGAGDFFMLEGFILAYIMSFSLAVYLNSISTNYNMITVIISNPLATLFFYFFSQFNNGIHYPIWVIICSLVLGFVSIILWLKGETITDYKKLTSDDSDVRIQNNY